jgi:hypothetical protein
MSAGLGRFMSADPGNAGADFTNPQSWNGYAYVLGNPLGLVDPSGMDCEDAPGGGTCVPLGFRFSPINPCRWAFFCGGGSPSAAIPDLNDLLTIWLLAPSRGGRGTSSASSGSATATSAPAATPASTGNLGLTGRQGCYGDALVNGALGFVPGYNATKTVASLLGFNFNPVQFANGNTGALTGFSSGASPFAAGSPTGPQLAAGVASSGAIYGDARYAAAGGASALSRVQDLVSRGSFALKSASGQAKLLQQAASLERLAQAASAAKNLGTVFSLASTAFDLYQCSQSHE